MTRCSWLWMVTPAKWLWINVLFNLGLSTAVNNITSYRLPPSGKVALCGYYTIRYNMWASSTLAYLYVTDTVRCQDSAQSSGCGLKQLGTAFPRLFQYYSPLSVGL